MDNLRILLHIIYIGLIIAGLVLFASLIDSKTQEMEEIKTLKANQYNILEQVSTLQESFNDGITITITE